MNGTERIPHAEIPVGILTGLQANDKKLLWRANLYIDEPGDWNDFHPWNSADNEWNKELRLANLDSFTSLSALTTAGDGGQVVDLAPFTPVRTVNSPDWSKNKVEGTVAYDYPVDSTYNFIKSLSLDSPFDYNYKMKLQRQMIKDWYTDEANEVPEGQTRDRLKAWTTTFAPLNRWMRYIHNKIGTTSPFVPSVGLFTYDNNENDDFLESGSALSGEELHAGVDCVGFAQRAASYNTGDPGENPYTWRDLPKGITEGNEAYNHASNGREYPLSSDVGGDGAYVILSRDDWDITQTVPSVIIPGDIFYYQNGAGTGWAHIGIVQDVTYTIDENGERTTNLDNIRLIESTFSATDIQNVTTNRTLYELSGRNNWRIVRLKVK